MKKKFTKRVLSSILSLLIVMSSVNCYAQDSIEEDVSIVEETVISEDNFGTEEVSVENSEQKSETNESDSTEIEIKDDSSEELYADGDILEEPSLETEDAGLEEDEIILSTVSKTALSGNIVVLDGIVYDVDTFTNSATAIGYEGTPTSLAIKTSFDGYRVKAIGDYAFYGCNAIKDVIMPAYLENIGVGAFQNCTSLKNIEIPASTKEIGISAFENCSSLNSVTFNNGLDKINKSAFKDCKSLTSVTIPSTVSYIGEEAFRNCTSLINVKLMNGVKEMDKEVFRECSSLTTVNIPKSLSKIPDYAFAECKNLKNVTIEKGITSIKSYAFYNTALQSITIPSSVTEISGAFRSCTSLSNVILNEGLVTIGVSTFSGCTSLTEITIPSTVDCIKLGAFGNCSRLTTAMFVGDAPTQIDHIFGYVNAPKNFKINYLYGKSGWTTPTWNRYPAYPVPTVTTNVPLMPPSFDVVGIFGGRNVTFNCDTLGATIYYTTENRSTLKITDPHVSPGETVTFNAYYGTVYARAYLNGKWSNVARLILKIPTVNTPTITKKAANKVKITTTTPGSIVYYTTDGTTPSSLNYAGKFWCSHDVTVPAGCTVKAVAVRSCFSDSKITTLNL